MMTVADKIKNRISECCTHFAFDYNGKSCGVDPFSGNKFDMWCGDKCVTVDNIEKVMNDNFFDGLSLAKIANKIDITDW